MKRIILALMLFTGASSHAQCSDAVKEAMGGLSIMAVYNTYITIGAISDGYEKDIYDSDWVQSLMVEQNNMISEMITMLETLSADKSKSLNENDLTYIASLKTCFGYLNEVAVALHAYSIDGESKWTDAYTLNRSLAWKEFQSLLGTSEK